MNRRLESLYDGQHWCYKYNDVRRTGPGRKPPRWRAPPTGPVSPIRKTSYRPQCTYPNLEKINVAEALLQLSEKPLIASFLLRPRRGGNVPPLNKPNITIHSQTTISQVKDYLVVKVANYNYQIGLQDPITEPSSFTALHNSVKLAEINPSSQELILFYQLEDSYQN